ncbi:alpha/beta hydrolase, partial [Enterobacter hormaechei]
EPKFDAYDQKMATLTNITVPNITIAGGNNGAQHPAPEASAGKFTGKYEHRTFGATVGHNPPQEDPQDFVKAVVDADKL